jgi:ssDNA-binding Zn-finger/Zn-ribbon topoisomerase 1
MDNSYTRWIHHGESFDADVIEHHVVVHDNDDSSIHGGGVREDDGPDHLEEMLEDLQAAAEQERLKRQDAENQDGDGDAEPHDKDTFLKVVMKEAKRQLYPGCTKISRFSFVVMLLHMKSLYRISNSAFSAILKVLAEAFPDCNTLPKSYSEAKNLLKELGLGYESIHVCFNNCVLFRKDYAKHDNCPVCGLSRWKDPQRKKIPQKVLRHFPLAPRLKRMFATKEASMITQL